LGLGQIVRLLATGLAIAAADAAYGVMQHSHGIGVTGKNARGRRVADLGRHGSGNTARTQEAQEFSTLHIQGSF
jgi:hypothetical protein